MINWYDYELYLSTLYITLLQLKPVVVQRLDVSMSSKKILPWTAGQTVLICASTCYYFNAHRNRIIPVLIPSNQSLFTLHRTWTDPLAFGTTLSVSFYRISDTHPGKLTHSLSRTRKTENHEIHHCDSILVRGDESSVSRKFKRYECLLHWRIQRVGTCRNGQ